MFRNMTGWSGTFSDKDSRLSAAARQVPPRAGFKAALNSPSQGTPAAPRPASSPL